MCNRFPVLVTGTLIISCKTSFVTVSNLLPHESNFLKMEGTKAIVIKGMTMGAGAGGSEIFQNYMTSLMDEP